MPALFRCTLCVRPVRSKLPARVEAERRKSFDFRNCISMQVNDTAKRYRNNPAELVRGNPCLPGERETAPSLGVRLVNAGRKREEKLEKSNRMTGLAGKATMDKTTEDALRCRHTCTYRRYCVHEPAKAGCKAGPKRERFQSSSGTSPMAFTHNETRHKAPS
jgi:hypothetical protein